MKKTVAAFLIILALAAIGLVYFQYFSYREIELEVIESNPQVYNGARVSLEGLVIRNEGTMFGPEYTLAELDKNVEAFDIANAKKIALGGKAGPEIDLSNYVSYTFNGTSYTLVESNKNKAVIARGTIIYIGQVTDAPPYYLELERINLWLYRIS